MKVSPAADVDAAESCILDRCCGTSTPVASTGTDPDGREWATMKCAVCGAFVSRVKTGGAVVECRVEIAKEWNTMIREQHHPMRAQVLRVAAALGHEAVENGGRAQCTRCMLYADWDGERYAGRLSRMACDVAALEAAELDAAAPHGLVVPSAVASAPPYTPRRGILMLVDDPNGDDVA